MSSVRLIPVGADRVEFEVVLSEACVEKSLHISFNANVPPDLNNALGVLHLNITLPGTYLIRMHRRQKPEMADTLIWKTSGTYFNQYTNLYETSLIYAYQLVYTRESDLAMQVIAASTGAQNATATDVSSPTVTYDTGFVDEIVIRWSYLEQRPTNRRQVEIWFEFVQPIQDQPVPTGVESGDLFRVIYNGPVTAGDHSIVFNMNQDPTGQGAIDVQGKIKEVAAHTVLPPGFYKVCVILPDRDQSFYESTSKFIYTCVNHNYFNMALLDPQTNAARFEIPEPLQPHTSHPIQLAYKLTASTHPYAQLFDTWTLSTDATDHETYITEVDFRKLEAGDSIGSPLLVAESFFGTGFERWDGFVSGTYEFYAHWRTSDNQRSIFTDGLKLEIDTVRPEIDIVYQDDVNVTIHLTLTQNVTECKIELLCTQSTVLTPYVSKYTLNTNLEDAGTYEIYWPVGASPTESEFVNSVDTENTPSEIIQGSNSTYTVTAITGSEQLLSPWKSLIMGSADPPPTVKGCVANFPTLKLDAWFPTESKSNTVIRFTMQSTYEEGYDLQSTTYIYNITINWQSLGAHQLLWDVRDPPTGVVSTSGNLSVLEGGALPGGRYTVTVIQNNKTSSPWHPLSSFILDRREHTPLCTGSYLRGTWDVDLDVIKPSVKSIEIASLLPTLGEPTTTYRYRTRVRESAHMIIPAQSPSLEYILSGTVIEDADLNFYHIEKPGVLRITTVDHYSRAASAEEDIAAWHLTGNLQTTDYLTVSTLITDTLSIRIQHDDKDSRGVLAGSVRAIFTSQTDASTVIFHFDSLDTPNFDITSSLEQGATDPNISSTEGTFNDGHRYNVKATFRDQLYEDYYESEVVEIGTFPLIKSVERIPLALTVVTDLPVRSDSGGDVVLSFELKASERYPTLVGKTFHVRCTVSSAPTLSDHERTFQFNPVLTITGQSGIVGTYGSLKDDSGQDVLTDGTYSVTCTYYNADHGAARVGPAFPDTRLILETTAPTITAATVSTSDFQGLVIATSGGSVPLDAQIQMEFELVKSPSPTVDAAISSEVKVTYDLQLSGISDNGIAYLTVGDAITILGLQYRGGGLPSLVSRQVTRREKLQSTASVFIPDVEGGGTVTNPVLDIAGNAIAIASDALIDGTYKVRVIYGDFLGNLQKSSESVDLEVNLVTTPMTASVTSERTRTNVTQTDPNLTVDVTIPEPVLKDSVKLIFTAIGKNPVTGVARGDQFVIETNLTETTTQITVDFSGELEDLPWVINTYWTGKATTGLKNGIYTLQTAYRDSDGNPEATTDVLMENSTQPIEILFNLFARQPEWISFSTFSDDDIIISQQTLVTGIRTVNSVTFEIFFPEIPTSVQAYWVGSSDETRVLSYPAIDSIGNHTVHLNFVDPSLSSPTVENQPTAHDQYRVYWVYEVADGRRGISDYTLVSVSLKDLYITKVDFPVPDSSYSGAMPLNFVLPEHAVPDSLTVELIGDTIDYDIVLRPYEAGVIIGTIDLFSPSSSEIVKSMYPKGQKYIANGTYQVRIKYKTLYEPNWSYSGTLGGIELTQSIDLIPESSVEMELSRELASEPVSEEPTATTSSFDIVMLILNILVFCIITIFLILKLIKR